MQTNRLKLFLLSLICVLAAHAENSRVQIKLFDEATFYDGYLFKNNPDAELKDGILRHLTSLYAVKMTDEQLAQIGDSLFIKVYVKACCDNYDRIGNINLALVDKGSASYNHEETPRIELGRFITPFMDKNKQPDTVPYEYDVSYVSHILRDANLRQKYDIWVEFELFGVPYAANQQISGCSGRSDVFKGTLIFETTPNPALLTYNNVLVPIVMKKPENKGHNLNNYSELGTDTIGKTTKTYEFEVPYDVKSGQLVLVTSNHGANTDGEEYNRRWHNVYVDDAHSLTYKPGRATCEPFRQYNTQANGIYGSEPRTNLVWRSFSNWCPGDVIDNRIIYLGSFKAGKHKVRINVVDAEFKDQQGDIPVSIFFQGLTEGTLPASISSVKVDDPDVHIRMNGGTLYVSADNEEIANVELYDLQGRCLLRSINDNPIPMQSYSKGMYLVNIELANGLVVTYKFMNKK